MERINVILTSSKIKEFFKDNFNQREREFKT